MKFECHVRNLVSEDRSRLHSCIYLYTLRVLAWMIKGIVHFEMNFWYVLTYLKGIQDLCFHSSFTVI